MSDLESSLQKWLLIFIVGIAITVASMNYWYKTLPEKAAREAAAREQRAPTPLPARKAASTAPAPSVTPVMAPAPAAVPKPSPPREEDFDAPLLNLPDGRVLGFAKQAGPRDLTIDWTVTDRIHPWIRDERTLDRTELPAISSQRQSFTALLLADGRLALVGGLAPRDMVALERKCEDCPDEYIPFGEATPSTSTDVFDFESGAWSKGPTARRPADGAMRTRDGRVIQVSLERIESGEDQLTDIRVEITDAKFTRWAPAGEIRSAAWLSGVQLFESREGAVLLLGGPGGLRAFHWNDGKLKPWMEGQTWSAAEQLDEGHLQLTQMLDVFPPRSQNLIVELP